MESLDDAGGDEAANAILTTDLVDKQVALELELEERRVRIGGMAKGSGMIHPDMATMLGFFSCDAGVESGVWQGMVQRAVQRSFNAITVDGDTSTTTPCWPSRQAHRWPKSTMPFWSRALPRRCSTSPRPLPGMERVPPA